MGNRRGETLVECLVAVALVSAVALPALAAMRGALAASSGAAARAEAAWSSRMRSVAEAALARFEDSAPEDPGADVPPGLPPLRRPEDRTPAENPCF